MAGAGEGRAENAVGWLVAIIVLPLLFTLFAVYNVLKVAVLIVRIAFLPATLARR